MGSALRPEIGSTSDPNVTVLTGGTALYSIYGAVQGQPGLIHGRLHDGRGAHCAIWSLFATSRATVSWSVIEEVASVNDSVPHFSNAKRRAHVLRWLRWKLEQIGISTPGRKAVKP